MATDQPHAAAYWIDHFVVPVNNVERWKGFMEHVLGGQAAGGDANRLSFMSVGLHHLGGSYQESKLPELAGLGQGLPRYGFYVRPADLDRHLRRFEEYGVQFTDPARTAAYGESGTSVLFCDPDGNQYELWAPDELPRGALDSGNDLGLGRISHAVLESGDLGKSAEFHSRYLGIERVEGADIPDRLAVLQLAGGGHLILQEIAPDTVTRGGEAYGGGHTAFAVRDEEWDLVHERLWDGLPEGPTEARGSRPEAGPRRLHEPWTQQRQSMLNRGISTPRGYSFCDWDNNRFHFMRGQFAPGDTVYFDSVPPVAD